MLLSINDLLKYKNQSVINRYKIDFKKNTLPAEEAFQELLKYFWITQKHQFDKRQTPKDEELNFICTIHREMAEIDDMWHTFLLFTKDYMQFCEEYFGNYIHHIPTSSGDRLGQDEFQIDFTRYLSYIYDNLGEETVNRWFDS